MNPVAFMPKPTPAPAVPKNQPSGWERWLPTIGSTVGSIGGDLLGGAADVATGGLATPLINPITMSTLLSGLGGAAGQATENGLSGQNPFQMNDLTQGGIGAGANLAGFGVGKLLGMGGKAIGQVGSDMATNAAAKAAQDAAAQETQRIGTEFAAVKPSYANVGDALDSLKNLGFATPTAEDMSNVGKIYTGSNAETGTGVMNFMKNEALKQAGGTVDLSNSMDALHSDLASPENQVLGGEEPVTSARGQLPKAPNNTATKIVQTFRNMLPGDTLDSTGNLKTQIAPEDGQRLLKAVGEQINKTTPRPNTLGMVDPASQAENNVWKNIYHNVRESLYNRPEVNAVVGGTQVTPDTEAMIEDAIKANGITDPQQAEAIKADLINTIDNGQTMQDWLNSESKMVNVSKVGDKVTQDLADNPQLSRNVKLQQMKDGTLKSGVGSKLNGKGMKTIRNIGALFGLGQEVAGGKKSTLMSALDLAAIAQDAPEIFGNGDTVSKLGNLLTRAGKYANVPATAVGNMATAQTPNATGDPMIQNALQQIQQTPNPYSNPLANAEQLLSEQAINPTMISGGSPASSVTSLMQAAQKYSEAQAAIESMLRLYGQAGGAQGPAGGALSYVSSLFGGGEASRLGQLKNSQNGLASILNNAGIGGAQSVMPSIFMNGPTANANIGSLSNILGALSPQVGNAG